MTCRSRGKIKMFVRRLRIILNLMYNIFPSLTFGCMSKCCHFNRLIKATLLCSPSKAYIAKELQNVDIIYCTYWEIEGNTIHTAAQEDKKRTNCDLLLRGQQVNGRSWKGWDWMHTHLLQTQHVYSLQEMNSNVGQTSSYFINEIHDIFRLHLISFLQLFFPNYPLYLLRCCKHTRVLKSSHSETSDCCLSTIWTKMSSYNTVFSADSHITDWWNCWIL